MNKALNTSVVLESVYQLIQKKVDKKQNKLVMQFADVLFNNIANDDLVNRNDSDLYGATLSLWNKYCSFNTDKPCIHVFNPVVEKHGWNSNHTVVEIIVNDMPFLVDSLRMALNRLGMATHLLLHSPILCKRDKDGKVVSFAEKGGATQGSSAKGECQSIFLIEIDHQSSQQQLDEIANELNSVVDEISLTVSDWQAMRQRLLEIIEEYPQQPVPISDDQRAETIQFLKWVHDHNFTLMGYRRYDSAPIKGDYRWVPDEKSSLGLMKRSISQRERLLSNIPASARDETLSHHPLILTKTNSKSRVHRNAYMDYVGIKRFDSNGKVIGEDRFIGLYSAAFYNRSATDLPVLKNKLSRICLASGYQPGSHSYKAFVNILETYPRDDLLQASEKELVDITTGVLQMQERGISRLFVRRDPFGRFYSCMVYVPRERYNTQLRIETQKLFQQAFSSENDVEFTTFFSESVYARTHYIVRVNNNNVDINVTEIEKNLVELSKSWEDKLSLALRTSQGESLGKALDNRYLGSFPRSYKEQNLPSTAVVDIEKLQGLSDELTLDMLFYRPLEESRDSEKVKLKLFHLHRPIHLSAVLPMLENFGLRVIDESPYKVKTSDNEVYWIMDFSMLHKGSGEMSLEKAQDLFQEAFLAVWNGHLEDDAFNRLVLGAGISGRTVTILRAYAKYMRQTGSSFSKDYIARTLDVYPHIAVALTNLFDLRFNPSIKRSQKKQDEVIEQINQALDQVSNLDDDRIVRRFLDMILATVRTNFYQTDQSGHDKAYVSFKVQPELIPDMPLPLPKFEIFVYSPRVEGVHLRGGKVARGGLRWSDRQEDFRTEVLGLVKAQQVKNTVIVPVGAKGGFVCKKLPTSGGRDAWLAEGQECYRTFIRSLLDITDNIVAGNIVPPKQVVRLDDDDPYLVVAADKGTATFSDIANSISEEYSFWLGDAFASGGSVGYDHKKMGITARGAWESVKRHFREMGIDCQTTEFTCVGVGDMAGDVFGNGMLLSEHTQLVCAFNHLHIFFDPKPNAKKTYAERQRLFENPQLSWDDFDKSLISKGGGVFSRSAKSIKLTSEMKKWLDTSATSLTPTQLIHLALKMPVDLMWNGGIGTYIKSSKESHAEVGDRANDDVRVNGNQVQAKVVGEGGNLGCTQLGRIEYAANGGRINTDFIDNVGGVDCSDNEVNIKILLNSLVTDGDLTLKQRNQLLYDMTEEVSDIVLLDCYQQTQSISVSHLGGAGMLKEEQRFIHGLEKEGYLNRELEFIPGDEEISERLAQHRGLTRPELSVLTAYGKMVLKEQLAIPEITDNVFYTSMLHQAFPVRLRERFQDKMASHPLRAEIIATSLANDIVNDMGMNFVFRLQEETGAEISEIADAFSIVKGVFEASDLVNQIEKLDNKIPAELQLKMLHQIRRTLRRASRWYLRHGQKGADIQEAIDSYLPVMRDLSENLSSYVVEEEYSVLSNAVEEQVKQGVPEQLTQTICSLSTLFSAFDLAQVAKNEKVSHGQVAKLYFQLGHQLEIHWFLEQINHQAVSNHWQALARASYREELDWQQRSLTTVIFRSADQNSTSNADLLLQQWVEEHESLLSRWTNMMHEFKTSSTHEFAKFSVALRELMLLSVNCGLRE